MTIPGFGPLSLTPISSLLRQMAPPITDLPDLFAAARDGSIILTWILDPLILVTTFELWRSTTEAPAARGAGDSEIIFSGLTRSAVDSDVEDGVTYFYTVFAVRAGNAVLPYGVEASASATAHGQAKGQVAPLEYVPRRGEFGGAARRPMAFTVSAAWGDLDQVQGTVRRSDLLRGAVGTRVVAPIDGIASGVAGGVQVQGQGFRFVMTGTGPLLVAEGQRVDAGTVLATLAARDLVFEIFKLPVGQFGARTVRPTAFYLQTNVRDGRGK